MKGEEKVEKIEYKGSGNKRSGVSGIKKSLACGLKHNTCLLFGTRSFIKFDTLSFETCQNITVLKPGVVMGFRLFKIWTLASIVSRVRRKWLSGIIFLLTLSTSAKH